MNHIVEECYSKHGYPPWYKQISEQDKGSHNDKNGGSQHVCNLNINSENEGPTNQVLKEDTIGTSLSADEIQKLLKLLDEKNDSKYDISHIQGTNNNVSTHKPQPSKLWILDTRAIDHVTRDLNHFSNFYRTKPIIVKLPNDLNHFSNFYRIKPIIVNLPNNSTVTNEFAGTKPISDSFVIFNVLYIPEFSFNLIYVQALIKDLDYKLIFSSKHC